jgi:hypothetical protein
LTQLKSALREYQAFNQWWLWSIIITAAIPTFGFLLYQVITGEQIGTKPASNTVLFILTLLLPMPMFFGFYFAELSTIIDSTGIEYGWNLPTSDLNFIPWSEIKSIDLIEYKFVGYGYKISRDYGTVYNTKGNKGIQIIKNNGSKILIGTSNADDLVSFLKTRSPVKVK